MKLSGHSLGSGGPQRNLHVNRNLNISTISHPLFKSSGISAQIKLLHNKYQMNLTTHDGEGDCVLLCISREGNPLEPREMNIPVLWERILSTLQWLAADCGATRLLCRFCEPKKSLDSLSSIVPSMQTVPNYLRYYLKLRGGKKIRFEHRIGHICCTLKDDSNSLTVKLLSVNTKPAMCPFNSQRLLMCTARYRLFNDYIIESLRSFCDKGEDECKAPLDATRLGVFTLVETFPGYLHTIQLTTSRSSNHLVMSSSLHNLVQSQKKTFGVQNLDATLLFFHEAFYSPTSPRIVEHAHMASDMIMSPTHLKQYNCFLDFERNTMIFSKMYKYQLRSEECDYIQLYHPCCLEFLTFPSILRDAFSEDWADVLQIRCDLYMACISLENSESLISLHLLKRLQFLPPVADPIGGSGSVYLQFYVRQITSSQKKLKRFILPMRISNKKLGGYEVILGLDFLQRFKARIDFGFMRLQIPSQAHRTTDLRPQFASSTKTLYP